MSIIVFIISSIWQRFHYLNDLYVWTLVDVLYCHWSRVFDLNQTCSQNAGTALSGTSQFIRYFSGHNRQCRAEEPFHWGSLNFYHMYCVYYLHCIIFENKALFDMCNNTHYYYLTTFWCSIHRRLQGKG